MTFQLAVFFLLAQAFVSALALLIFSSSKLTPAVASLPLSSPDAAATLSADRRADRLQEQARGELDCDGDE